MLVLLEYKCSTSGVNPVSGLPSISWNLIGQIPNIFSTNQTTIFSINFVCSLWYSFNNNSARVVEKTEEAENVYIVEWRISVWQNYTLSMKIQDFPNCLWSTMVNDDQWWSMMVNDGAAGDLWMRILFTPSSLIASHAAVENCVCNPWSVKHFPTIK